MDLGLKRKRALVTGSTAGIGLATAKQLASEGAFVYINGRTEELIAAVDALANRRSYFTRGAAQLIIDGAFNTDLATLL